MYFESFSFFSSLLTTYLCFHFVRPLNATNLQNVDVIEVSAHTIGVESKTLQVIETDSYGGNGNDFADAIQNSFGDNDSDDNLFLEINLDNDEQKVNEIEFAPNETNTVGTALEQTVNCKLLLEKND